MSIAATTPVPFDVARIRADFPLLARSVHGKPLVYFDNANTAQKPETVIASIVVVREEELEPQLEAGEPEVAGEGEAEGGEAGEGE